MLDQLREAVVASVRRRAEQGDCPTEPAHSIETLENVILDLATPSQPSGADQGEVDVLELLRDDAADFYSLSGDENDDGLVITQHRYYRWGDAIIAIGELNWPNQWDDDAFDAKWRALEAALAPKAATAQPGEGE